MEGFDDEPIDMVSMALLLGATFVARGFSGKPKELAELIVEGINHNGFAVIDTFSPCPTFNKVNTFKSYREEVADLPKDYDPSDLHKAIEFASSDDPMYLGVLYRQEGESFEDHLQAAKVGTEENAPAVSADLFRRYG